VGIPFSGSALSQVSSGKPPAGDLANGVVQSGFNGAVAFTATGVSPAYSYLGAFNVLIYGNGGPNGNWSGTVQLERCFDGGTTWVVCGIGGAGQPAIYTSAGTGSDVSVMVDEFESGVYYRLHCTAYVSGTINFRMSTTSPAATAWGIPPG
jgi:hypothetical protein